jgi:hypothetical protein
MRIVIGEENQMLKEVYVNDFGDNYHRTDDEPSTDLEKAARRLRRRYKNINEYMNALAIYQEYMVLLMMKHGGPDLFKIKLRDEYINDFIPPKPRMKNTAKNKMLLKNKILVSSVNINKLDVDKLDELIEESAETFGVHDIIMDSEAKDPVAHRLAKEGNFNQVSLRKVGHISSVEFLEEYFSKKNGSKQEEKEEQLKQISLTRIASDEFDKIIKDTDEEDDVIFYRGNYMNRDTVDDLRVYQDLGARGWNSVKLMKDKGVSKRVTKIVKSQNKKNKKKNKKSGKKRREGDDFLMQMMNDNDHDNFSSFEEDMLNFTAKNVFGR